MNKYLLYLLLITSNIVLSQVPNSERNALIAFYNATNGPNWAANNSNWNTSNPVSTWSGITVTNISGVDHVTKIDVNGVPTVDGNIPPEIGDLIYLTELKLDSNNLSGGIPTQIGNLLNLEILLLDSNNLSGGIPTQIGNLLNLEILGLYNNELTGTIPIEIANCTSLKTIDLESNQLTGSIPNEFENLTSMQTFYIGNMNLTGNMNFLSSWSELVILVIQNSLFTGDLDLSNNLKLSNFQAENNSFSSINIKSGENSIGGFGVNFNTINSLNLNCIQVDNEVDATNDNFPYIYWNTDSWSIFSENCNALSVFEYGLENNLSFYPNPTNDYIFINNNNNNKVIEVEIYTVLGEKVFSQKENSNIEKIDFSSFKTGVYFIKTTDNQNNNNLGKVIKE